MDLNTIVLLSIAAAGVVAACAYTLVRKWAPASNDPFLFFRCPGCEQKLRFLARLANKPANCPRCRQVVVLPRQSQAEEKQASKFHVRRQKQTAVESVK